MYNNLLYLHSHLVSQSIFQEERVILRAKKTHARVMGIEHDAVTWEHQVAGQRHHHPTCARVPLQRGNRQLVLHREDIADYVIDRVDVVQRLDGGILGIFNAVQVDAVAEEIVTSHEDDNFARVVFRYLSQCAWKTLALLCIHGAIVEVEMNIADSFWRKPSPDFLEL